MDRVREVTGKVKSILITWKRSAYIASETVKAFCPWKEPRRFAQKHSGAGTDFFPLSYAKFVNLLVLLSPYYLTNYLIKVLTLDRSCLFA